MNRRAVRDLLTLLAVAALLGAVQWLPPDTSLAEIERRGILDVCVPPSYPPLVTGDPERPGLDVELLRAVADELGVELGLRALPAIGRDFNPRSWRLTRAQCAVIAGGVVDTPSTRSFLDVTRPHAETGWDAIVRGGGAADPAGRPVGILPGAPGIDRLALSRHLRETGAEAVIVRSAEELAAGLSDGRFAFAVTDALVAGRIAAAGGWTAAPLPGVSGRYPVVFGLWKGDLTLKRAVDAALRRVAADGRLAAIRRSYLGEAAGGTEG